RVLVVGPLLADTGVRSKSVDRHFRDHHDFRRHCGFLLVSRRATLEVLRHLYVVVAGPSPLAEHLVQAVGVGTLVGVSHQLATLLWTVLRLLSGSRRYAPFDLAWIEWSAQHFPNLLQPFRRHLHGMLVGHRCDPGGSRRLPGTSIYV